MRLLNRKGWATLGLCVGLFSFEATLCQSVQSAEAEHSGAQENTLEDQASQELASDDFFELHETDTQGRYRVSLGAGTLGVRLALGAPLGDTYLLWLTAQKGEISTLWGVSNADYHINARLEMLGIQLNYFPWGQGFYAHLSAMYSRNRGKGRITDESFQPLVAVGYVPVGSLPDQFVFDYQFEPWLLGLGVGWQGRPTFMASNWSVGWHFGLLFQARPEAQWIEQPRGTADQLLKEIEDDLSEANLLPDFLVQLSYVFN